MKKFSYQTQKMSVLKRAALLFSLILIFCFYSNAADTIFSDNFSGLYPGDWFIGNEGGEENDSWAWPNAYAHCYSHPSRGEHNYPHNLHVYMERRNLDLSGYTGATLSFDYKANTKTDCGIFTVNIRDQKGSWHRMFSSSGESASWKSKSIDLGQFAGQSGLYVQFRFDFDSDDSSPEADGSYKGVYVDNVVLTAGGNSSPSPYIIPPPGNIPVIQDEVPVIRDKDAALSRDGAGPDDADPVTVTTVKTDIPADAEPDQVGGINGKVTNGVNGIENVMVKVYDLYYAPIQSVWTNNSGDYTASGLPTGNYKVKYYTTGNFIGEWYDDKSSFYGADVVPVNDSQTTTLADAVLTEGGSISGQVTDTSGNSVSSIWVGVYDLNYYYVSAATTNSSGNYTVSAIPAGNYKVHFDVSVNYIGEWYDDKSSFSTADPVSVLTGQNTAGIDAQLSQGAGISGQVTARENP